MIKHIVMFKMKDSSDKEKNQNKLIEMLNMLPSKIDVVKAFEVGANIIPSERAFDVALISEFESLDTLAIYRDHPEHVKVVGYLKEVCEKIQAVDYNF